MVNHKCMYCEIKCGGDGDETVIDCKSECVKERREMYHS